MKVSPPASSVSRMVPASATVEEADEWIVAQGGQPVSKELWERLAKSGIFPELPPRGTTMVGKGCDLITKIRGSLSGKLSSSDEFAARKADEILLEERGSGGC